MFPAPIIRHPAAVLCETWREMTALGDLLELLHGADQSFETVEATFTVWDRSDPSHRLRQTPPASHRIAQEPTPADADAIVHFWRAGQQVRVQHERGRRHGAYGVRDGALWWRWDPKVGARSNVDDPTQASGTGEECATMFAPARILSALRFTTLGVSVRAGRSTIRAEAVPRHQPHSDRSGFALHQLGVGADQYILDIDRERGIILHAVALANREPSRTTAAVAVAFDKPIDPKMFVFRPPAGERIRPVRERACPRRLPLAEACERATFTVLVPTSVPATWSMECVYRAPLPGVAASATVVLDYQDPRHVNSVQISESSVPGRDSVFDELIASGDWRSVELTSGQICVTTAGNQSQAYLERLGTFVFLSSLTLTADEITAVAAGLAPVA